MANIQQRKSADGITSYRVQVRLKGFAPQQATFKRKTDAKAWAQQVESAMREGRHLVTNEAKKHTVGALIDRFLESLKTKRPQAYKLQKPELEWWKKRLGARTLTNLTPAAIAEARDALLSEDITKSDKPRFRTPATANRYLAALSKACSVAVREWHWMPDNPVFRVQKEKESRGRVRYLTPDEKDALLAKCDASRVPGMKLIVTLALTTGMRRGEILGLRWPDIDLVRNVIVIQKTKNNDRRSAPIVPQARNLLGEHAQIRTLTTDLVFARPGTTKPVDIDHAFQDVVSAAEIKDFRFHDLRHTAASYLAMSGATTAEIAAVLGHRTLAMVKRYAHLSDQHTGAVVERMANKFFS